MAFIGIANPLVWRVGLAVAWLVGSWLFGPKQKKNKIFDPGAEEMPRWNTALRGITIPVFFGTNRVSAQIVWQHDYTVLRKEKGGGAGGGKMGGSGGGKGSAQTGSIDYEYYWDLIYHLGMTPEPYELLKGWVGAERMNNDAVAAIIGDTSGEFVFVDQNDPNQKEEDKVKMSFEDSFYYNGYGPAFDNDDDPVYDGWEEFNNDEGTPIRWPHTVYVGFKQLFLGSFPSIPQMSFEVGPAKTTVEYDGAVKAYYQQDARFAAKGGNNPLYITRELNDDGTYSEYTFMVFDQWEKGLRIYSVDNTTQDVTLVKTYSMAEMETLVISYSADIEEASYIQCGIISFQGTPTDTNGGLNTGRIFRLAIQGTQIGGIRDPRNFMMLGKLDKSGNLSIVGSFSYYANSIGGYLDKLLHVVVSNAGTVSDPIISFYNRNDFGGNTCMMCVWPSPSYIENNNVHFDPADQIDGGGGGFNPSKWLFDMGYDDLGHNGSFRRFETFFWTLPRYRDFRDITNDLITHADTFHPAHPNDLSWRLTTPTWGTLLFWYVGYSDLLYGDLPTAAGGSQTTPQIAMLNLDYIWWKDPTDPDQLTVPYYTIQNTVEFFDTIIKTNNLSTDIFPFTDANLYADGVTTDASYYGDYYPAASVHKVLRGTNQGAYVAIFTQQLPRNGASDGGTASPDYLGSYPSYFRAKVTAWRQIFFSYRDSEGNEIYEPPWPSVGTTEWSPRFQKLNEIESQAYNLQTDIGLGATADDIAPRMSTIFYVEENNAIYYATQIDDYSSAPVHELIIGQFGTINLSGGKDVTPPYIIYQILTSDIFGIGLSTDQINTASYGAAVAYCERNNFYVSVQYRREESVLQIIDDLLSVYGGFLVISNGVVKFKQLEYLDGAQTSVRTIDNAHLINEERGKPPVTISKAARQDTFNKVRVNFFDRTLEYAQNQVEEADEVDQDLNGIRPREFPPIFVMEEAMARQMAIRALWSNLYSRDTYQFSLGWKDCDLEPGDVITLVDSFHQSLQGGVTARIIEWRERERGKFDIVAKQEFDYILSSSASALAITSASIINRIKGVPNIQDFTMYELPQEFNTGKPIVYVSWASYEFAAGAYLYLSPDGETYSLAQDVQPYQLNGIFMDGLPNDPAMMENVNVLMAPKSDWLSSASLYYNALLSDASQAVRAIGGSLLWCGSEMMAYQGATLIGQNQYRLSKLFRGWGGTNIHAHNSGSIWYKQGAGIFHQEINTDRIGTLMYYKVAPTNLAGVAQNVSSITAKSYRVNANDSLKQNAQTIQFAPQTTDLQRGKTRHYVGSTVDIAIQWGNPQKNTGYGVKGYGIPGYGESSVDSIYLARIEVIGSGGVLVHSALYDGTYYTYGSSLNATENGAWCGSLAFKVTPYNEFGYSIKTEVLSLELW